MHTHTHTHTHIHTQMPAWSMDALWCWTGGWSPTEKKTSVIYQLTLMTVSVYSDSLKCSLLDFEYVLHIYRRQKCPIYFCLMLSVFCKCNCVRSVFFFFCIVSTLIWLNMLKTRTLLVLLAFVQAGLFCCFHSPPNSHIWTTWSLLSLCMQSFCMFIVYTHGGPQFILWIWYLIVSSRGFL